jgi:hypothetical protein
MVTHDFPLARPTAEWISRYAADLLSSTPGLQPLDAVRAAMAASTSVVGEFRGQTAKPSARHRRATAPT